ncbi:MAG: divalent-cation tolerance protein CutA [Proteobacteria bacterium]|nr:divalent-cation tolerance protein CutA [Pseudomonadota bacterium]
MTSQLSLLYTTFPHEEEAIKVTRELLEKHLIACANILGPIKSLYSWEGKLEESQEVAVLFKTTSEKVQELIVSIQEFHSYETPAILEIPVGKSAPAFCNWVFQEVR